VQSQKEPVLHLEGANIWSNLEKVKPAKKKKPAAPIKRVACPPEYLCPLCKEMYDNPCIARCCGRSACFNCFEVQPDEVHCPLCKKPFSDETTPIPNPKLFDTVASLNLEYFDLPGGKVPQLPTRGAEVVDLDPEEKIAEVKPPEPVEIPTEKPPVRSALPGPGLPPPELLARAWSGNMLPVPPASPTAFPWSPPPSPLPPHSPMAGPPGASFQPCMLSAEQFRLWQQSLQEASYSDYSSSDDRERRKKKKKKEHKKKKEKKEKKRHRVDNQGAAVAMPMGAVVEQPKSHRKTKRRRDVSDGAFQ